MKFIIKNEGNTIGCLLRDVLEENGATFFACNVKHPQDTDLQVTINGSNPKEIILDSVFQLEHKIQNLIEDVKKEFHGI